MSTPDVIRAWTDPVYRESLTSAERASLAPHPSGLVELNDDDMTDVNGATTVPCGILATEILSCWPSCEESFWDGSCAIASYGCCI